MGLFTPFTRRARPERSAFPTPPLPLDPAEQRALEELRARREEARRREQEGTAQ
jgi:hypothetical protein